jgi:putative radical SAM enzyme (TIGR03279 family)
LNKIKLCSNDCIFCFVKQLPKNLRKSLYVKDDDFLLSFTKGNFITLTNVKKQDIEKIIKYRLEPLYISIHSTNEDVRRIIFGNESNMSGIKNLKYLDKNKIETHIQIVVVPEINDGNFLRQTLNDLIENYKFIKSIGIVPVGITKYNQDHRLKNFYSNQALEIISLSQEFKDRVYLSDEFFLIAGIELPQYSYYKKFYQIENGIGIAADFIRQTHQALDKYKKKIIKRLNTLEKREKVLIITAEYGYEVFLKYLGNIYQFLLENDLLLNFDYKFEKIKNYSLGGNVKVTGLLFGNDIISHLNKKDLSIYGKILLPDIIFNDEGLTLDSYKKEYFKKNYKNLKIIKTNGASFVKGLFNVR